MKPNPDKLKKAMTSINISVIAIVIGFTIMHIASILADVKKMELAKCDANGTVRIQFFDGGNYTCQPLAQVVKPKQVVTK